MAWHPTQELILAYGTVEGRIHKVEWGPLNGNEEDLGLYVVAEGKLVVYNTKILTRAPSEVDTPDDTFVYTFAWKPDYTILLVGTKTGSVILYSKDLKILSTNYFQHKLKEICWHPDSVQSDLGTSKYCYWFAAVSNSKDVTICNFQTDVNDGNNIVTKYERSEDVINCIAWSPYASNQLVIASDEGTAQVWDVEADVIISTYVSPNFEGISAVIWSPTSSDLIISAAKDHTIRVWSILEHPKQDENEIKHLRKKVIKEIMNEQTDLLPKGENVNEEQTETPKNKKVAKVNILPIFYYPKETVQVIDDLKKLLLWKEGLFTEEPDNTDSGSEILKIFGSKHDMLNIMERNDSLHQQKGKYSLSNTLSLFKGDINTKIKKAIEDKRVNPWVIMMSPMVSIKTWQSACETYAQQLSEEADSDALEIASYYLACHKVEQAIDILCEAAMFREALALAKCRLAEDNSAVTNIIEKWAKQTLYGKYEDAASVLFRRSDATTLKFAAELSEKSGNEELHKAILLKYNLIKHDVEEKDIELPTKLDAFLKKQKENILCEEKTTISTKSVFLDNQNVEIIHYEGDDAEIETKDKEQDRLLENDNKSAYISENDLLEKNMSDTPDVKLSESHTSLDNENTV
ncbi:hypothetical protein NQ315_013848 [Exocentrus adspersus]|uniref:Gem-associated protein 5 TPR domain-containing protein n=1 Tax=Exocentrus adspersus TaxID=1586481 RepID=A0AAV8VGY5_9CUCU|nr:hypothetical protein NQ315_013848 [Exocentrus adspersus]